MFVSELCLTYFIVGCAVCLELKVVVSALGK